MAATIAPNLHRQRRSTILGRAGAVARERGPGLWAKVRGMGARLRTEALTLGGLGLVTAAAWEVDSALGKLVAGGSLLVVEFLAADDDTSPR